MKDRISRGLHFGTKLLIGVGLGAAALCNAQPPSPSLLQPAAVVEIALAVKSPETLARYVESHRTIDWRLLRNALGLTESQSWLAPCGSDFPAGESPCSAKIEVVSKPDQAILVIRGGDFSYTVEHLRYLQDSRSGWRFAGEISAFQRNSPSHYALVRLWNKPFIKISNDYSQNGVATRQILEDWFDLTQPDFEPVFSIIVDGAQSRFGFGVGRTLRTTYKPSQTAGPERIEVTLTVHFDGVGLDQEATYLGVYERATSQKKFTLRNAYSRLDRRETISTSDFEELADPFSGLSNEKLLAYALPGLQKIAAGSDSDAKEWLKSILENTQDTPETRTLLQLLR